MAKVPRRLLGPACAALLCAFTHQACSSPDAGRGVQLRLAPAAPAGSGCIDSQGLPLLTSALLGQSGTLRLSVVRRGADGKDLFVCDATARVPSEAINLDLGTVSSARLYGELFDNTGALVATGMAQEGAGSDPTLLVLRPTAGWSCPGAVLSFARGFHAVTPLPSGELLITGGLTAYGSGDSGRFQVVNRAEIYDPRVGRFFPLDEERGVVPRGRAFHQAAVLDQPDGKVRVMLYGGIADSPGKDSIYSNTGKPEDLLRLAPRDAVLTTSDTEILLIDVANRRVVRPALQTAGLYPPSAFAGGLALSTGGLLVAGGYGRKIDGATLPTAIKSATLVQPQATVSDPMPRMLPDLAQWFVGPSVTLLPGNQALILGAALAVAVNDPAPHTAATRVTSLDASATLTAYDTVPGPATAFHTATLLPAAAAGGDARLLLTGGFVAEGPLLLQPAATPADAVRLMTVPLASAPTLASVVPYATGADGTAYRPAGFEAATALSSGLRVLITGGTPEYRPLSKVNNCPTDDPSVNFRTLCVLRQSSVFDAEQGTLAAAPLLPVGRMGHRQVLLDDGAVMVIGGTVRPGGAVTTSTADAVVYNPRTRQSAGDTEDPIALLLQRAGRTRTGMGAVQPCKLIK